MKRENRWEELLQYKLEGSRFDARDGVDVRDLRGLVVLRAALLELAKADFRRRRGRVQVPRYADALLDVRIRGFKRGSVAVQLYLRRGSLPTQPNLFGEPPASAELSPDEDFLESVHRAAKLIEVAIAAGTTDLVLPGWMPASTFDLLGAIGPDEIDGDESYTITAARKAPADLLEPGRSDVGTSPTLPPEATVKAGASEPDASGAESFLATFDDVEVGRAQAARSATAVRPHEPEETSTGPAQTSPAGPAPPAAPRIVVPPPTPPTVDHNARDRIRARAEEERRARVESERLATMRVRVLEGEVRAADLDDRLAMLKLEDGTRVRVTMTPEHERQITSSLRDHDRVRLRVRGVATHNLSGSVREITAERVAIVEPPDPNALSEALFERLASEEPRRLIALIESGELPPHFLTYAVEVVGRDLSGELAIAPLLRTLGSPSALVREGTVIGLAHHAADARVIAALKQLAAEDPSPAVRSAARSAAKWGGA
jgi:hypothetical protein